jgi:LacI family transcriptional regulator
MAANLPTIKDVARLAGVSTATVSAAINERSYVSPLLKERVADAILRLGYSPSGTARSLRTQTTRLIGVIIADITNLFFAELVRNLGSAAQACGYSMLLLETDHDETKEIASLNLLAAHRVDGVILAPTGHTDIYFQPPFSNFPKPIVTIDRVIPNAPFDAVSIDNQAAGFEVTNHILTLGHRRIAIIAGTRHLANTIERLAGFNRALAEHGLTVDPKHIVYADFREDRAYDLTLQLLSSADRPSALFVSNNQMLIGTMRALTALGLSCPDDVSVAAIDDFPWADTFSPKLTTVRQPIQDLADASIRLLHERMTGARTGDPERVVLPASLVIRESCRPLVDIARPLSGSAPSRKTVLSSNEPAQA